LSVGINPGPPMLIPNDRPNWAPTKETETMTNQPRIIVALYRKESASPRPKVSAKVRRDTLEAIEHLARVQRPSLTEFVASGEFYRLPALTPAQVKDAAVRAYAHGAKGWEIPTDSLGRKADAAVASHDAARSTAESVRLWLAKNMASLIEPSHVAVVVEEVSE